MTAKAGYFTPVTGHDGVCPCSAALGGGVTFIDAADGYGDGRSEEIIGRVLKTRAGQRPFVTTKCARGFGPDTADSYTKASITRWVEARLKRLQVHAIDLLQLHCPPPEVYYMPEVFGHLDEIVASGKLRRYGVSVEKVEEGLKAIEYPGVASVQII